MSLPRRVSQSPAPDRDVYTGNKNAWVQSLRGASSTREDAAARRQRTASVSREDARTAASSRQDAAESRGRSRAASRHQASLDPGHAARQRSEYCL